MTVNLNAFGKKTISFIDKMINFFVLVVIVLTFIFGIYSIIDNRQLEQQADADNYKMYKPTADDTLSFEQLQKLNPDVFGWLTIDNTLIDYPLLQGKNNDIYINTAPDGSFSLTGSIFLDYRNSKDFSDFNSIIYGHHVENDAMFGGLDHFSEKEYFNNHQYGSVYFEGKKYKLEIYAFLTADAYDLSVFKPNVPPDDHKSYLAMIKNKAVNYRDINITEDDHIILLSTCSSESTNGRNLLAAKLEEELPLTS
ncbi:MAG: class B sortase [Clostridia bacterium]|nr:class B sortase [Clostridia bacterium]